jgi:superkiller protein 3
MANAWLFLGISLFDSTKPSEALPSLRRYTSLQPGDAQGHSYLGMSLASLEQYQEAAQELSEARKIEPRNTEVLYHLAECYLHMAQSKGADVKELQAAFQRTVGEIAAVDPDSVRLYQLKAGYYEAEGDSDKAIQELEVAVKSRPHVQGVYYTLGCLYSEKYRYEEALAQFHAELELDSPYPRTYLQIGHIYTQQHQPDEALSFLAKATQMEPESGVPWVEMGRVYYMKDQYDKAASAFERAIKLGDKTASTYLLLSRAYRKMGKLDLAQQAAARSEEATHERSDKMLDRVREANEKPETK